MKKYLLVTTLLAVSAGAAQADVSLSGDARMGFTNFDADNKKIVDIGAGYRARVRFSMSGETDAGFKFGSQFRLNDAVAINAPAASPTDVKGTVYFEVPDYGRLTFGDTDGAAQTAVVQFGAIGYEDTAKQQEFTFLTGGDTSKGIDLNYSYTSGPLVIAVSMGNPGSDPGASATQNGDDRAIGASYTTEFWKVAAGFEDNGVHSQSILSGSYGNGQAEVKIAYGLQDDGKDQYVITGNYILGHTTLTAYYRYDEIKKKNAVKATVPVIEAIGIGASYDLGGGMSVAAGYATEKTLSEGLYNVGLTMSF